MQRINTTLKRIVEHYEVDIKTGTPKQYSCMDAFNIVMGEFGGKHEYTTPDNWTGDNSKSVEYSFENGLKVWAGFHLNEFKQYQLNHLVFGK